MAQGRVPSPISYQGILQYRLDFDNLIAVSLIAF